MRQQRAAPLSIALYGGSQALCSASFVLLRNRIVHMIQGGAGLPTQHGKARRKALVASSVYIVSILIAGTDCAAGNDVLCAEQTGRRKAGATRTALIHCFGSDSGSATQRVADRCRAATHKPTVAGSNACVCSPHQCNWFADSSHAITENTVDRGERSSAFISANGRLT